MFRLEDRQLHILTGLLCGASIVLFCMFGLGTSPQTKIGGQISGMQDFSEAWVCTYEPKNEDQLQEKKDGDKMVVDVVSVPAVIPVKAGKEETVVTLTHKAPDIGTDPMYLTLETKRQKIRVMVDQTLIYTSEEVDDTMSAFHIIPIAPQYRNAVITIELTGQAQEDMEIGTILAGKYSEVLIQAFLDNGVFLIAGVVLISISMFLFMIWIFTKNTWRQKRLLIYNCLEGAFLGSMFVAESRLIQVIVNWNYGLYFVKSCLVLIAVVLHLMVMRCFVNKKRVLFFIDVGILFYGIFYISMMVLQALSLLTLDQVYLVAKVMYAAGVFLYTLMLAVAVFGYGHRIANPALMANGILVISMVGWLVLPFLKGYSDWRLYILTGGVLLYMVVSWIYGLKNMIYMRPKKKKVPYNEETIRRQVIEQLNPNLLFASFKTLQSLIKNGSTTSVKMIYYISVYIRSNLKALEQRGEIIAFEEELEHIMAYLQLQKTRNHKLGFAIECKEKEFKVPRHSLEPLVENAVKHGIAGNDNKGNVVVRTYQRQEGYAIQIIDDGIGFDKHILKKGSPTALLNLFRLLETSCQAETEVISREGKGTVITIVLPMLENDLLDSPDEE